MKHQVLPAIFEDYLDVVLLQETLMRGDFKRRVAGYTLHSLPAMEGIRGCAQLMRSAISHRRVGAPGHCGDDVVMARELKVGDLPLPVCNLYRSHQHQLEACKLLTLASQHWPPGGE